MPVYFSAVLQKHAESWRINDKNMAGQMMCMTCIVEMKWLDPRLAFTSATVDTLVMNYGTIWLPPIVLVNSVSDIGKLGSKEQMAARVNSSGLVEWLTPVLATTACEMKVINFPFDTQTCSISMVGWGYDNTMLELQEDQAVSTMFYAENGEWELMSTSVSNTTVMMGAGYYKRLTYSFTFRRRYVFMFLVIILPAISNSILMCFVFILPHSEGEKMGYSLTVLLTYIVLLTMVTETLPPISTDTAILNCYLMMVMLFGVIATLLTAWTVSIYNTDESKPIPNWMKQMCRRVLIPAICFGSRQNDKQTDTEANASWLVTQQSQNGAAPNRTVDTSMSTGEITVKAAPQNGRQSGKRNSVVPFNDDDDKYQDDPPLTWTSIAELMDSFFLRVSLLLTGFCTLLLIFYFIGVY